MFYERYLELCRKVGLKPTTAATKAGLNRGTVSVWKKKYEAGLDVTPDQETIDKICAFFGCSEQWLRGMEKAPSEVGERMTDEQLKFALFGGAGDITDAMMDEVKQFAQMVKLREEQKKKG